MEFKVNFISLILIITSTICMAKQRTNSKKISEKSEREGKIFSLFTIVNFKNEPCVSTSQLSSGSTPYRNGTCFTSSECSSNGGSSKGSCAAGFGVCCVFTINSDSSLTVNYNDTYIQNPGYPSTYTGTSSLTYTINKCANNICQLRLDFETFTLEGPSTTSEGPVGPAPATPSDCTTCTDSFTVTVSSGQSVPVICGQNTGQHIYLDIGNSASSTVEFAFGTTSSTSRQWDVKVAQIPCGASYGPPDDCLQWSTGITGRITTFNFLNSGGSHLNNQNYNHCIRQESGYCCVQYTVCSDTDSWTLDNYAATPTGKALTGTNCVDTSATVTDTTADYIVIEGSSSTCGSSGVNLYSTYCGLLLSTDGASATTAASNIPICDCTAPFSIGVVTDCWSDVSTAPNPVTTSNRGVCLNYQQIPCNS